MNPETANGSNGVGILEKAKNDILYNITVFAVFNRSPSYKYMPCLFPETMRLYRPILTFQYTLVLAAAYLGSLTFPFFILFNVVRALPIDKEYSKRIKLKY